MAVRVSDLLGSQLGALRYEPTAKRLRASVQGQLVADTCDAMLIWEPGRIVPAYAVPVQGFSASLQPTHATEHATDGQAYDVVTQGMTLPSAAFKPDDADLADYLLLDFAQFDWREEDESIVGHPHDPFHRIDILKSSRNVRIELDGQLLAESERPVLLFETLLPVRFYLPAEDVTAQMEPSDSVTYCAYKGRASYFSLPGARNDIAWIYPGPLREAGTDPRPRVLLRRARRRDRERAAKGSSHHSMVGLNRGYGRAMKALIITDVQNDFCEGGSLEVVGGAHVARAINDHLHHTHYDHIVATKDFHIDPGSHFSDHPDFLTSWPRHCVVGTAGAEFHPDLHTDQIEAVFTKGQYSAAYSGFEGACERGIALTDWLRQHGVDEVVVVGIATDYCVLQTAQDAAREGFTTTVLQDLTAGVARETSEKALDDLRSLGVAIS